MGVQNPFPLKGTAERRSKRARVLIAVKLRTPMGEIDARLRDLSRKGALVECKPTPQTGTEVLFMRGETVVPARVAWSQPGRVGLEFHYMIDEADVLVNLKPGTAKPMPRFRRPAIREGVSEQDRKLAATWGVQVGINLPDEDF